LLQAIQRVQIGIYNTTTTRDPRPAASVWLNQSSTSWIAINGNVSAQRMGARYYIFTPEADLNVGWNNFTFFVQQDRVYKKTILVNRINTSLDLIDLKPANNSAAYNNLNWINFTMNDYVKANISLSGEFNKSWTVTDHQKYFNLLVKFNDTYGNYSLAINASDHYGNFARIRVAFTFQKSMHPYISIISPKNASSLVNLTISINATFSETCNVTVENLNVSSSSQVFINIQRGILGNIPVIKGWNYINISVMNAEGRGNSTLLKIIQVPYIVHKFTFSPFVIPGGKLHVDLNFSTNYTQGATGGDLWYMTDYNPPYTHVPFTFVNTTWAGGVLRGILRATIDTTLDDEHVLFNFTVHFGPEIKQYDQNGQDFHVPVAFLYQDMQGPVIRSLQVGPSTNIFGRITSNDKVKILVDIYDVTSVRNASVLYSLDSTFATNETRQMTYRGTASNKNGYWDVILPSRVNGSRVYYSIITHDTLNNTSTYSASYMVNDVLNANLDRVIPGMLNPYYEKAITGAISTLLAIMELVIVVFIVIFISINDQNVKREMFREEDRIFILKHVCKIDPPSIFTYYYMEQLVQDSIGYGLGALIGFLVLGPVFVSILKVTLVAWTFDFQDLFYFSFITLESWVTLLLVLFVLCALLLKLVQVDKHVRKMAY
ncbi:MAG: hypothetical protein GYA24_20365, partial [Candidatus Lokiarchaeota archaeon]|nr:hypothetical protein [Candidatus Lokiarchaeota archaeon]